jgi:mannose-6-phosphate isomerase-like protein (cupin superfamily)
MRQSQARNRKFRLSGGQIQRDSQEEDVNARTKSFMTGLFIVLIAVVLVSITVAAQDGPGKLHWKLRLNETRGPIRTADMSEPSGNAALSEILGGPTNGSDNAYLIYTRMAAGAHGPALFTLPVEDDYVVLSGKMTVQIGTDKFVAGPNTAVVVPPNTPHAFWNAEGGSEANFEVIASANPHKDLSRDLMSMLKPAQATKVENAAKCIREIKFLAVSDLKPGLNGQAWTDVTKGSPIQVRLDSALKGNGNTKTHVHLFEQVYFGTEGDMSLTFGLENLTVKKGDIAIIPPGLLHANASTTAVERHITLLLPQPPPGSGPADIDFERTSPAAGGGTNP